MQHLRKVVNTKGLFLAFCGPKSIKFCDSAVQVVVSNLVSDCLSRFVTKIFAIKSRRVEKRVKKLCQILVGRTLTFLQVFVSAIYPLLFGKAWLSSVR